MRCMCACAAPFREFIEFGWFYWWGQWKLYFSASITCCNMFWLLKLENEGLVAEWCNLSFSLYCIVFLFLPECSLSIHWNHSFQFIKFTSIQNVGPVSCPCLFSHFCLWVGFEGTSRHLNTVKMYCSGVKYVKEQKHSNERKKYFVISAVMVQSYCLFVFHTCSYFILNKRTGFLIIKENTPPGSYDFQVRVSDGMWPDVISSVKVNVRDLRDDAIYNSASLRIAGTVDLIM